MSGQMQFGAHILKYLSVFAYNSQICMYIIKQVIKFVTIVDNLFKHTWSTYPNDYGKIVRCTCVNKY